MSVLIAFAAAALAGAGSAISSRAISVSAAAKPIPQFRLFRRSKGPAGPLALFPLRTVWTLALNNALTAPPAYDDERAFFPIEGDRLVAYDLTTGKQLWIAPIHTTLEPAAGSDLVFVTVADAVSALHATSGAAAWRLQIAEPLATPIVWDTGWLVLTTKSGSVLAFRADDGTLLWRAELGAPANAKPSLGADRVYVPLGDGRVVALSLADGKEVWTHKLGGAANDLLPLEDRIFVGSRDNFLYCLKTQDGSPEWRWRTGADVVGVPAVDEDSVYFVSFDNVLRALRRSNGVQRWKRELTIRPTRGLLKAGDTLIVSGANASQGFSAKDGNPAGDIPLPAELAASPHLVERPGALPSILVCVQDLASGASVVSVTRDVEPKLGPVNPLPNAIAPAPLRAAEPTPSR